MPGLSPVLPLSVDWIDGAYTLLKDLPSTVKQNLKMLVLTSPGERVMDPEFGVGIRNYLFEQNTEATYREISAKVTEQVDRYMPFINLTDLYYGPETTGGENLLVISLRYEILPLSIEDILSITLPNS